MRCDCCEARPASTLGSRRLRVLCVNNPQILSRCVTAAAPPPPPVRAGAVPGHVVASLPVTKISCESAALRSGTVPRAGICTVRVSIGERITYLSAAGGGIMSRSVRAHAAAPRVNVRCARRYILKAASIVFCFLNDFKKKGGSQFDFMIFSWMASSELGQIEIGSHA